MDAIFNVLNEYVLAPIFRGVMYVCGNNFAVAIFVFTLLINVLLIPLTIKSQKSSVQQTKIKPKLDELKKKYGDDKQKYSAAMQELYQKENVSMAGGCLPMLLRLVILMSIYYLILSPVSYLTTVDQTKIDTAVTAIVSEEDIKASRNSKDLALVTKISTGDYSLADKSEAEQRAILEIKREVNEIDFDFFGIDLTETPHFAFNISAVRWNWIIPLLSFAAAMATSLLSMSMQKSINPDGPNMKGMMLAMPLLSLVIAFAAPCGLGYYWACSSLISGGLQSGVQYFYGPHRMIAKERAKNIVKASQLEQKTIDSTDALGE